MRSAAVPFVIHRENSVVRYNPDGSALGRFGLPSSPTEITSTRDELYGLLRLVGNRLLVQWRRAREVSQVGREIRTDRELAPLRQVAIPLSGLAMAAVRWRWRGLLPRPTLNVVAADLSAFDSIASDADDPGLILEHPGELVLEIRLADRHLAKNFASELRLAVSEEMLRLLDELEAESDPLLRNELTGDFLAAESPAQKAPDRQREQV